jgi:hypothetical protein
MMSHPHEVMTAVTPHQGLSTSRVLASAMRSLFEVHPAMVLRYPAAHEAWGNIIAYVQKKEGAQEQESKLTQKQLDKVVVYEEVEDKFQEELRQGMLDVTKEEHMRRLLLAVLLSTTPKRADLGDLLIVRHDGQDDAFADATTATARPPELADSDNDNAEDTVAAMLSAPSSDAAPEVRAGPDGALNYLLLSRDAARIMLYIQSHKTSDTYPVLKEELPEALVAIINQSLERFPRDYLFVRASDGKPFNAKQYSEWFGLTFQHYFSHKMGVSLWRHVHENHTLDYNNASLRDLRESAERAGHAWDTAFVRYKKPELRELARAYLKRREELRSGNASN